MNNNKMNKNYKPLPSLFRRMAQALHSNWLLVIIESYLLITLLMYLLGPLQYSRHNTPLLIILVLFYQTAFLSGYLYIKYRLNDRRRQKTPISVVGDNGAKRSRPLIVSRCVFGLNVFFVVAMLCYICVILNIHNLSELFGAIGNNIKDLGGAYNATVATGSDYSKNGLMIARLMMIMSPLTYIAFVYSIYNFISLRWYLKASVVAVAVVTASQSILTGQNIGVFSTILTILTVCFLSSRGSNDPSHEVMQNKKTKKRSLITIMILFIAISGFIIYFSTAILGRMKPNGEIRSFGNVKVDSNNMMLVSVPAGARNTVTMLNIYLSSGYHAMDIALSMDYKPTYGLGNGFFLINVSKKIFSNAIYEATYQYRMRGQWDPTVNWHTAYVWYANDFTFPGVIIIMLALGMCTAWVLSRAREKNIYAVALLPLIFQMIIFLPCNNIVFGNPTTFIEATSMIIIIIVAKMRERSISRMDSRHV